MGRYKNRINKRTRADAKRMRGQPATPKNERVLMGHAMNRARSRYGTKLSTTDIERMNELIRSNNARYVTKESTKKSMWLVDYENVTYACVYNKQHHCIVTVLPASIVKEWEDALPREG